MATFGERLKQIREQCGWSLRELAERSGVPYETILTFPYAAFNLYPCGLLAYTL